MKTTPLILLASCLATQAQAFTLPKQTIKSYECEECVQLSHDNLQDKWGINNLPLHSNVSNLQKSYGYKQKITLEDLRKGVTITTLAPGAVIRLTPLQNKTIPALMLKTPENKTISLQEASSLYSEDEAFGEINTKHQTMLQIKPELGAGHFLLKASEKNSSKTDEFILSVLDKFSLTYLEVSTQAIHYQYGDRVTATISLKNDDSDYGIDDIKATLVGPAGQNNPLTLTKIKRGVYEATTTLNSEVNDRGENWYVEAEIQSTYGPDIIKRSGHTAFSYAVPSATLLSVKKLSSKPLTFVATLDVATPSRYALQSVLFRKNGDQEAKPVETSQKAQWLEAGKQVIQFTFDNANQLSDDNLYLGYLRLIDYGQLKTVYQYNTPIKLRQLVDH